MGMNILFFKKKSMKYILNFVYWIFLFFNQIFLKNMYNCAMRLDFFSMFFFLLLNTGKGLNTGN